MRIIDLVQGSEEWKNFRRFKIGASDTPAIMGVSPWDTPLSLWERKISGDDKPPSSSMIRGAQLEAKARDWLNKQVSDKFQPIVVQHHFNDAFIASLDGWNGSIACEIKCPGEKDHLDAINGLIPEHYYPQLQHIMCVTQTKSMIYVSFDGENGIILQVTRNDNYCETMAKKCFEFLEALEQFKPPAATERDQIEITDEIMLHNAKNYILLSEQIDLLEADLEFLKKDLIKGAGHPRAKIGSLRLSKIMRKGAIDYDAIPILKTIDLEQYRKKPVEQWRITTI